MHNLSSEELTLGQTVRNIRAQLLLNQSDFYIHL